MRLTYANVMATIAVFLALGGVGLAATHLKKNSVKSKQIKDGAIATQDIADGAVTSTKLGGPLDPAMFAPNSLTGAQIDESSLALPPTTIAPDSITGAQIDESTLQGVNAATTGGMQIKKIDFRVPYGTPFQSVLTYPGIFRIDAQCQNSGDFLDVAAFTAKDSSRIYETAMADGGANDTDAVRDVVSRTEAPFESSEAFEVDNRSELGSTSNAATIHFSTLDGFVALTQLNMATTISGCVMTGYSIGG